MVVVRWWLPLLAVVVAGSTLHAQEINWQEAVARLARERTQAETCVLARKEQPASLPDLEDRLQRGFEKREAFCQSVQPLIPQSSGQKGVIDEIVSGAIGPIVQAVKEIYLDAQQQDELTRKTIQTQLEATSWPVFASVTPSS